MLHLHKIQTTLQHINSELLREFLDFDKNGIFQLLFLEILKSRDYLLFSTAFLALSKPNGQLIRITFFLVTAAFFPSDPLVS